MPEYLLPDVGEGLTEAEIVGWKVKVGDVVAINDVVVEIETAKSLVELPSPFAGTVTALLVAEGETVEVGTPIIAIGDPAEAASSTSPGETPPADLQIDVEPHHTVRDLIFAASNYCEGKWDESQPVFLERNDSIETAVVCIGILLSQARSDRLHFRSGLRQRYARLECRDGGEIAHAARLCHVLVGPQLRHEL